MVRVRVSKLLGLNFDPNPNCNFALLCTRPGHAIRSIHGQGNPHPKRGEVGMTPWRFAVVCRWRVSAICTIRQAKTFLFIVFPWIKLQEESGYSKAIVVFLYCKRCAGTIDVDSSRNRIDASQ